MDKAIQDLLPENYCFGCGPLNPEGLQIKSFEEGEETVCTYNPQPHQAAGPRHVLNGGVIATLIDCHGICTAVANGYRQEGREPGEGELIWYVTGSLTVRYHLPTSITEPVLLRGRIEEVGRKKTLVKVTVQSQDNTTAEGEVLAIRVSPSWRNGS